MVGKLLASTTGTAFEVFTVEDDGFELLSGRERLHVVEGEKEAWNPANVLGTDVRACKGIESSLCTSVRRCRGKFGKYGTGMGKLDGFTRYSNVQCSRLS